MDAEARDTMNRVPLAGRPHDSPALQRWVGCHNDWEPFGGGTRATFMIRIPQCPEKCLARLAKRSGRSLDELAREAILQYEEDSEDVYEAGRILCRVRSGRERTFTLDEVAKRLRLEH